MDEAGLLSLRQKEVARLAASDLTEREIALDRGVTVETLRGHWDGTRARLSAVLHGPDAPEPCGEGREALLEELRILRQAVEQGRLLVWSATGEGHVDYVSASFVRFCGLPRAELIGPGCRRLMPEAQHEASSQRWREATRKGRGYTASVLFKDAEGALVPHLIRLAPLRAEGASSVRWVGTARRAKARPMEAEAFASRLLSPLSGCPIEVTPCGPAQDPSLWMLVREHDGVPFVTSHQWLRSALVSPPCEPDRTQALFAARHCSRQGETLAVVNPADAALLELSPPRIATTPWLIRQ